MARASSPGPALRNSVAQAARLKACAKAGRGGDGGSLRYRRRRSLQRQIGLDERSQMLADCPIERLRASVQPVQQGAVEIGPSPG